MRRRVWSMLLSGSLLLAAARVQVVDAGAEVIAAAHVKENARADARSGAVAPAWPPLRGEVGGELRVAALPELGLAWTVELEPTRLVARARRAGVDLEVELRPPSDAEAAATVTFGTAASEAGAWRWRVRKGEVDLAELWPVLREVAGEAAAGWSASGRVTLAGEGTWSAAAGPVGELRASLREGWARSDARELELSGVELDAATRDLADWTLGAGQRLRVAKLTKSGAELRDLAADFGLEGGQVLAVTRAEAAFLGGRVRLRPFRVPLKAPVVEAAADVDGLQLGEVARLMPWAVAAAAGSLRGRIELAWDESKGLRVRDGGLSIVRQDAAEFRLAPSPGLLTGGMRKRFAFMPRAGAWLGWFGFTNPAYAPLREIELGRAGLRVETLQVTFWPDGPGGARTATAHIVGRPSGGQLVEEVTIDLNFHGPWSEFMAFGLNQEASYGFRVE